MNAAQWGTRYSRIDALHRVRTKTVLREAGQFEPAETDGTLTTTYSYSMGDLGLSTDITIAKAPAVGGTLTMSRTYDRRGKLVQTTQHVSTPTPSTITTGYFYDAAGSVSTIRDTKGNKIVARYDDLGRKIRLDDPDRGTWTFKWDGLGRLETQTDARAVVSTQQYDGIGRLIQRSTQAPNASPSSDAWTYDSRKLGVLDTVTGADGYSRTYEYDDLLRPTLVTTHVPSGPTWVARDLKTYYGYDGNYGRPKAMTYPSGETIAFDYDGRGHVLGETPVAGDGTRGSAAYRRVQALSERGQITDQLLANGIRETAEYWPSTGLARWMKVNGLKEAPPGSCPSAQAPLVRQLDYTYDHFLNLAKQKKQLYARDASGAIVFNGCAPTVETATESYDYDELQRLLDANRSWTNITVPPGATTAEQYAYDDVGNITKKSDYCDLYTYGVPSRTTNLAGPHAVIACTSGGLTKATYAYDANGNMLGGDGRSITFDNLDRPTKIVMGSVTTQFRYAPDGSRYLQRTDITGGSPKTVYYADKQYERIDWDQRPSEEKTYAGPSVVIYSRSDGLREVRYVHMDRLGSTEAVTTAAGSEFIADAHSMDAFGKPRWSDFQASGDKLHPDTGYYKTTDHGFTGHEHLDDTYLIHMNGRVYDYRLGRFLSVDPIISNPANSQSINPYSYIGNNPLSGVDPTGYMANCDAHSFARCDTIWYNPPATVNVKVVDNSGHTTFQGKASLDTPLDKILGPPNNSAPDASPTGTAPESDRLRGALAFDLGQAANLLNSPAVKVAGPPAVAACYATGVCEAATVVAVIGLALTVAIINYGSPEETLHEVIATDATGTFKPGEKAAEPSLAPATDGAGAMSRGPHDPGSQGSGGDVRREAGGAPESGIIYRAGGSNPGSLKLRPGEDALSFRDSLSNPTGARGRPVFGPGDQYIGVEVSKLPPGSVIRDNVPLGHVSVRATPEEIRQAIVEKGKFPR